MNTYRVLVTDNLHAKGVEIFKKTPGIEVVVDNEITQDQLRESLKDFDALVVRGRTKLTAELMETTERLKDMLPEGRLLVTESGIKTREDVQRMQASGVNTFLVGEAFMREEDPGQALKEMFF